MLRRTRTLLATAALLAAWSWPPIGPTPGASAAGLVTTCTLQSQVNPSEAGSPARFRFFANNVGSIPGPVGLLTFFADGLPLGLPVPLLPDGPTLDRSSYVYEYSDLSAGDHLITVLFVPGLGSTPCPPGQPASVLHTVRSTATQTSVSSDVNPSVAGQPVTLTADVDKVGGGAVAGSVQFVVDGAPRGGAVAVDGDGRVSITVDDLAVGDHTVRADFTSSDPGLRGSSGELAGGQHVDPAATTTSLTVVPSPSESGDAVELRAVVAVVAPGRATPAGTVTFAADGFDLGARSPSTAPVVHRCRRHRWWSAADRSAPASRRPPHSCWGALRRPRTSSSASARC